MEHDGRRGNQPLSGSRVADDCRRAGRRNPPQPGRPGRRSRPKSQLRLLHRTIKAVTEDLEKMSFNTAISRLMEFINEIASGRAAAAELDGAVRAAVESAGAASGGGAVAVVGAPGVAGLRAVARLRRGADCRIDWPRSPCKSTENCAARFACRREPIRRPSRRLRATTRRSPRILPARPSSKSCLFADRLLNFVVK